MPMNQAMQDDVEDAQWRDVAAEGEPGEGDDSRKREIELYQALSSTLVRERDEYVAARAQLGVDRDWAEDLDMYNSRDPGNNRVADMMETVEQGFPVTTAGKSESKPTRSKVFIGLTRQKTNAGESRLADILLPTDDRNWGIKPTPRPSLAVALKNESEASPALIAASGMQQTGQPAQPAGTPDGMTPRAQAPAPLSGQPLKVKDIAAATLKQAKEAAESMQTLIEDQLNECDYNGQVRKCIHWAAVLGTGIMKGPVVANKYRRAWQKLAGSNVHVLQMVKEMRPTSVAVDPRNVYPDPAAGDNPKNGRGIFERADMTEREVRDLAKQPGYNLGRLQAVLKEGPKPTRAYSDAKQRSLIEVRGTKTFERWEWWGSVPLEQLRALGAEGLGDPGDDEDPIQAVSCCVIMINDIVVKAFVHPMETGDLPYDFFVWERVADSPWGHGVPRLMNSQQRVLNAAWRMMMDNAALSAGPQIVINSLKIEPANGKWEITGRKVWRTKAEVEDVTKAMEVFNIDNNQQAMQSIIEMAQALIDEDTGLPRLVQGERGNAPETVGGMQMLLNSTNVVLRRQVKRFDDDITRPHISRYYDFNMEHHEDESVKGDFEIDARGSSALVVRDIQNQALMQLLTAYFANPTLQAMVKIKELFKKALQAQHIDTEAILYDDTEIEQRLKQMSESSPKDPRIEAATIKAQADVEMAKARAQSEVSEIELRKEIAGQNFEAQIAKLSLERDLAILKMAEQRQLTVEQIKAQLASVAIQERGKKELFVAETKLKMDPANPTNEGI